MSDYMSDSYIKDIKGQIKYTAQLAAAAEDFDVAQQLYAVLFDLQLREEGAAARVAGLLDASAPNAIAQADTERLRRDERLRLVPTVRTTQFRYCLKCQAKDRVIDAGGLCSNCRTIEG